MDLRTTVIIMTLSLSAHATGNELSARHAAKLPDGTRVELVAIRPFGGSDPRRTREKPGPWWGPDGTLLSVCPDERNWVSSWNDAYLMVVAIENTDDVSCRALSCWGHDLMVRPIKEKGPGFENRDMWRFTLRFGDQKSADIRLGVATGQWKKLEHWSLNEWSTPYDHFFGSSEQIIMRCPEQKGPDVVAEVTQVVTERATRLVVFDQDGNLYLSKAECGGDSAGLVRFIHRFKDLDISSIDHLEFQVRPYDYWVTFRNVSLDCGHKTEVGIDIKRPGSLLGEVLPSLESLDIGMQWDQFKGKAVCVCFFDMQQRPSRHVVTQLNQRVLRLEEKDIEVIAIQASKTEENELNEWISKNTIRFPVGTTKGDTEKIFPAWGVKSLPWLILTDEQRIVRAEGFTLSELERRIKDISTE